MKTILILVVLCLGGCGYWNKDYVHSNSEQKWREQGWDPVAYEGYQWGLGVPFTGYGGAKVWYRLRNVPDNGITYSGYLVRWGNELHVYGPHAKDAIRPDNSQ